MYSRLEVYNWTLSALKIPEQLTSIDDKVPQIPSLNLHYRAAVDSVVVSLKSPNTASPVRLYPYTGDLDPTIYGYANVYEYPADVLHYRGLLTGIQINTENTYIYSLVRLIEMKNVILTDADGTVSPLFADCHLKGLDSVHLSSPACMALVYKLASRAAPDLIAGGKVSQVTYDRLERSYLQYKQEAGIFDMEENKRFARDGESSWVQDRVSGP